MNRISNLLRSCFWIAILFKQITLWAQHGENPSMNYCHQSHFVEGIRLNKPEIYDRLMNDRAILEQHTANYIPKKSDEIYTIPIVFHVLHNGGEENISNEQIYEAVAILNRDYRLLNADAAHVKTEFQGMPTDVKVEFKLATIAPDGTCFGGITRTQSPLTVYTGPLEEFTQVKEVFDNNDVYKGMWPHEKYLNVVVAKNIGGAGGYTDYPNDQGTYMNTIFMRHITLGENGTAVPVYNRSLTHEIGHWLNLMHTWGDSNSPGIPSNCDIDDQVDDTPNTVGVTSCVLSESSCGTLANVENYMDYSFCSKMFTPGQVARMRAALTSTVGGRNNIWTQANLQEVGAIDNAPLCRADFYAKKRLICAGNSVMFEDRSVSSVTGWLWSFEGGIPASSTLRNPVVQYDTPGVYSVTLSASNDQDSKTELKMGYITVMDSYSILPFHEGFEYFETIENTSNKLFVENLDDPITFEITNTASFSGKKSIKLNNFEQEGTNTDNLVSSPIDLSNEALGNIVFSYRYAHRNRDGDPKEFLRTYFSNNCGDTWIERTTLSNSSLAGSPVENYPWTPTSSSEWTTVHIPFNTSIYNQFLIENMRFKLSFTGKGGNNLYIDDINLYRGEASEVALTNPQDSIDYYNYIASVGISDDVVSLQSPTVFPNPSKGQASVHFVANSVQKVNVDMMDMMGKRLQSTEVLANTGTNIVQLDCSELASGAYLLQLSSTTYHATLLFTIE